MRQLEWKHLIRCVGSAKFFETTELGLPSMVYMPRVLLSL